MRAGCLALRSGRTVGWSASYLSAGRRRSRTWCADTEKNGTGSHEPHAVAAAKSCRRRRRGGGEGRTPLRPSVPGCCRSIVTVVPTLAAQAKPQETVARASKLPAALQCGLMVALEDRDSTQPLEQWLAGLPGGNPFGDALRVELSQELLDQMYVPKETLKRQKKRLGKATAPLREGETVTPVKALADRTPGSGRKKRRESTVVTQGALPCVGASVAASVVTRVAQHSTADIVPSSLLWNANHPCCGRVIAAAAAAAARRGGGSSG